MTSWKSFDASAVINEAFDTLLAIAFSRAETIEAPAMSIPIDEENMDDRVIVNRPEPQYASIRYLTGFVLSSMFEGGIMWSRI